MLLDGPPNGWKHITVEKQDRLLVKAATEIICRASDSRDPRYSIVYIEDDNPEDNENLPNSHQVSNDTEEQPQINSDYFHSRLR